MGERQVPGCFGCNTCGYQSTMFKAVCPACGAAEMVELKGLRQYASVLVKLDNGCRAFGIFLGDPGKIKVGASVVVSKVDKDSNALFFDMG